MSIAQTLPPTRRQPPQGRVDPFFVQALVEAPDVTEGARRKRSQGAIAHLIQSRGAISGAMVVGMSAADIIASLPRFTSVDVRVA